MLDLQAALDRAAQASEFSGVVRLSRGDEVLAALSAGMADRERKVPNTLDTRFGIASGTKGLTALAVLALVDEGRLHLEQRLHAVADFDLSGVHPEVTLSQLLTHTAGVYDYYDEERITDFDAFRMPISPERLLRPSDYLPMVVGGEQKFEPGARFAYSNGGYVLLGILIEQLTGDYHAFVTERVLRRAGMRRSGFFRMDGLPEACAQGYVRGPGGHWQPNTWRLPIIGGPDGGAFSTAEDMAKLWRALRAGALLSPALTRRFLTRAVPLPGGTHHYTHGAWVLDDGKGAPTRYLVGADAGVSFRSVCFGDAVVGTVLSNTSDGAWPMAKAVRAAVEGALPASERAFDIPP